MNRANRILVDLSTKSQTVELIEFNGYPSIVNRGQSALVSPPEGDYDYVVESNSVTPVLKKDGVKNCGICGGFCPKKEGCFSCSFWDGVASSEAVVVDGAAYSVGPETDSFKGFGGRRYVIRMNSGKVVETTNLWHRGQVPHSHRSRLRDNAQFA